MHLLCSRNQRRKHCCCSFAHCSWFLRTSPA